MRPNIESHYVNNIDRPSDDEMVKNGLLAEELVLNTINHNFPGFDARLSSSSEDSGEKDIGPKQTIDAVAYLEGRPVMGIQITTSQDIKTQKIKMQELINHPFLRLDEMKPKDPAIPKVLVHLTRELVSSYKENPAVAKNPEVVIRVIDGIIRSLQFDLTKTKNPIEQIAIKKLIEQISEERKKHIH